MAVVRSLDIKRTPFPLCFARQERWHTLELKKYAGFQVDLVDLMDLGYSELLNEQWSKSL